MLLADPAGFGEQPRRGRLARFGDPFAAVAISFGLGSAIAFET